MKVKNIMFSGFAAAILMGAVAEASAAPVAVASKGYVDSIAGTLSQLDTTEKGNLVLAINEVKGDIPTDVQGDIEDGTYTTTEGFFNKVMQTDGKVTVDEKKFDTVVNATTGVNTDTAPTTKAVYEAWDKKQDKLDSDQLDAVNSGITSDKVAAFEAKQDALNAGQLAAVNSGITSDKVAAFEAKQDALNAGQLAAVNSGITSDKVAAYEAYATSKQDKLEAGKFININEETGEITTTYSAGTNIVIDEGTGEISTKMPAACQNAGVVCVLTSEGGKFAWAVLTEPFDGRVMVGETAQGQVVPTPDTDPLVTPDL